MVDAPRYPNPEADDDTGTAPDRESATPWGTYVFGIVAVILVLLFVVLHLTGVVGPGGH